MLAFGLKNPFPFEEETIRPMLIVVKRASDSCVVRSWFCFLSCLLLATKASNFDTVITTTVCLGCLRKRHQKGKNILHNTMQPEATQRNA